MKTFHIINATFIGPTQTKNSRIKIHSARFKETIFISFGHPFDSATKYLKSKGFHIVGTGYDDNSVVIITDTFEPLKPLKDAKKTKI
jgi:hypothetical protein